MADEKGVNPKDIDASFVISSFKNKERRNNPSSEPKPLLPPEKEKSETENQPEEETPTVVQTETPETTREDNKRKRNKQPDYENLFIQEAGITARTGKSVYIRKEHHDKILKIIQVIGKNQISLFSYIDNVLSHHLDTYQDIITELYNKNNESIF